MNDDQSAQRDKPLDGSTGEAPSKLKSNKINSDAMAKRKVNYACYTQPKDIRSTNIQLAIDINRKSIQIEHIETSKRLNLVEQKLA